MECSAGRPEKRDAVVSITDDPSSLRIEIDSPVQGLFGSAMQLAAEVELERLGVTTGTVRIKDNQALDFVIRARIQAAVAALRTAGGIV